MNNPAVPNVPQGDTAPTQGVATTPENQSQLMVPKWRLDEAMTLYRETEAKLSATNQQLEEANKYKAQVESLTAEIETLKAEHEAEKTNAQRDTLLEKSLKDKVVDLDVVKRLLDLDKLTIEGDEVKGLDEQIKELQTSKAFLFKKAQPVAPKSATPPKPAEKSFAKQLAEKKVAQGEVANKSVNYFK